MIFTRRFIHLPDLFKVLKEYSEPELGSCRPINFKLSRMADSKISSYSEIKKDGFEVDPNDKENFWIEVTLQHTGQYDHDKFMQSEYGVKGNIISTPCTYLADHTHNFYLNHFKTNDIPNDVAPYLRRFWNELQKKYMLFHRVN